MTASRALDLQAGGGFSYGESDYNQRIMGGGIYSTLDFKTHCGAEVDFHQLNSSVSSLYERTYEVGGRYLPLRYGRWHPYGKVLYGRGVLNIPVPRPNQNQTQANLAYNMFVGGGGVDFNVRPWLNARIDLEYQRWLSGTLLPDGLTPIIATAGVAYHFGSNKLNGRRWVFPAQRPEKPIKAGKDMPPPTRELLPTPPPPAQEPPPPAQEPPPPPPPAQ